MFKLTGEDIDLEWVRQVMEEHFTPENYQDAQELILPSLQEVQERYGYVSEEAVSVIAAHLDISETRVFGVMTFYNDFRFKKPGNHVLLICNGMACRVVGSQQLINEVIYPRLGLGEKETTPDGQITMQIFPGCLGACDQAPLCMADGTYHAQMDNTKLDKLIDELLADTGDEAAVISSGGAHA
ncbi:MAG TPA: NAD(P)H-dependent oxidoreductase subunit E [Thermomicrobiales bacterium]|jgi:NADH-quinone oxidoreductase subunit E